MQWEHASCKYQNWIESLAAYKIKYNKSMTAINKNYAIKVWLKWI